MIGRSYIASILCIMSLAACSGSPSTVPFHALLTAGHRVKLLSAPAAAVNYECLPSAARIDCPLTIGNATYAVNASSSAQYLSLTNSTSSYLQISSIQGYETNASNGYGEYGAYLDAFSDAPQAAPAIGQVGYVSKDAGTAYPPVTWDDSVEPTALSVPPNHKLYVYWNGKLDNHPWTFVVNTQLQTWGVQSWRQPRGDEPQVCNGATQSTSWAPWQNTTGAPLYLRGALIYAAAPGAEDKVQHARLFILTTTGAVRWSWSPKVRLRGRLAVPVQKVLPGEYIAAQGFNTCAYPGQWDWAAFMYVSTG